MRKQKRGIPKGPTDSLEDPPALALADEGLRPHAAEDYEKWDVLAMPTSEQQRRAFPLFHLGVNGLESFDSPACSEDAKQPSERKREHARGTPASCMTSGHRATFGAGQD